VRWPRLWRADTEVVRKLDEVHEASIRASASVEHLLVEIDQEERLANRRSLWSVAIGSAVLVATGVCGAALLLASSAEAPTVDPSGRIGVVLLDDPTNSLVQVDAAFSASTEDASRFDINVSVFPVPAKNLNSGGFKTRIGFLFCGPIREGLEIVERNEGPQPAPSPVTSFTLESDSFLGDRTDCDILEVTSSTAQVLLSGKTAATFAASAGERVLYAFPGVTTTSRAEDFNGTATIPLPVGATVSVSLASVPSDLQIYQAAPQIPSNGRLSWVSTMGTELPPDEYRVAGVLGNRQTSASVAIFAAGALVGVAGAALLWVMEAVVGLVPRARRRSVRDSGPSPR
jgi:hypothetical protein